MGISAPLSLRGRTKAVERKPCLRRENVCVYPSQHSLQNTYLDTRRTCESISQNYANKLLNLAILEINHMRANSGRVPAWNSRAPEFNHQHYIKRKIEEKEGETGGRGGKREREWKREREKIK